MTESGWVSAQIPLAAGEAVTELAPPFPRIHPTASRPPRLMAHRTRTEGWAAARFAHDNPRDPDGKTTSALTGAVASQKGS